MSRFPAGWIALAASLAAACTPTSEAIDLVAETEAVMAADRAFNDDTAENGVDGWVRWFAEDGVMVIPGREVRGHDEIRRVMTPGLAEGRTLTWDPTRGHVAASADLGYTVGRYESRAPGPEGEVAVSTGTYVTIWKKDATGGWKVALDVGAPDPPAAPTGGS